MRPCGEDTGRDRYTAPKQSATNVNNASITVGRFKYAPLDRGRQAIERSKCGRPRGDRARESVSAQGGGGGVTYRAVSSSSRAVWSPSSCAAWSLAALRPAAPRFFFFLELCPIGQAGRSASGRVALLPRRKQTAAEADGDGCEARRSALAPGGAGRGVGRKKARFCRGGLGWIMDGERVDSSSTRLRRKKKHDCGVGPGQVARWGWRLASQRDFSDGVFLATADEHVTSMIANPATGSCCCY